MTEQDQPAAPGASNEDLMATACVAFSASLYQSLAIVAALAEARAIDPEKVATWAETFGKLAIATGQKPEIDQLVSAQLNNFALVIRAIIANAPGGAAQQ